jgi:sRNA-binding regulator protein Hfq
MDYKKAISLLIFYFVIISAVFFLSKYYILKETENVQELMYKSLISGLLGSLVLTYMLRRWSNQNKK